MSKPRGSMHSNPLLGASGSFTLDSPALLVPAASPPTIVTNSGNSNSTGKDNSNSTPTISRAGHPPTGNIANFFQSPVSDVIDPFANVGLSGTSSTDAIQTSFDNTSTFGVSGSQTSHQSVKSLSPSSSTGAICGGSYSSVSGIPEASSMNTPGLFLLPNSSINSPTTYNLNSSSGLTPPPVFSIGDGATPPTSGSTGGGINLRKLRYVAPPGINSVNSISPNINSSTMPMSPSASNLPTLVPDASTFRDGNESFMHMSNSTPDFSQGMHVSPPDRESSAMFPQYNNGQRLSASPLPELVFHWFYLTPCNDPVPPYLQAQTSSQNSTPSHATSNSNQARVWKPFTMIDSVAIEDAYTSGQITATTDLIPTDGGRYDVNVLNRTKEAVYWTEQEPTQIRRCSWFYQSNVDGRWVPYEETLAEKLEQEYKSAHGSGRWGTKLEISGGEYITLHSSTAMMHFPTATSSTLDDWGQVQPPQDPMLKPRIVHRGLEGLPEIPDGEAPGEIDHLVFVIHGIGSACDMKLRSIVSVTDGLRELTAEMSERHFSFAHLSGKATRVEFLPVNWHKTLHGEDEGTDSRLQPMTLRSIPKLRGFVNDTLLDVLFYTSPVYCQKILDTVCSEINRMYTLFMARNESFAGEVSFVGHSLGSLIMFDVLCNQTETSKENEVKYNGTTSSSAEILSESTLEVDGMDVSLEQLFKALNIESELAQPFVKEGIDFRSLLNCSEEDMKEGGMPIEEIKKLVAYCEKYKRKMGLIDENNVSGLEAYNNASTVEDIKYTIGPAGMGQPSVKYPQLMFKVSSFYALGSPIGMFMAVRGIDTLGPDFKLPTCPKFFNIFHPYDPVAYRIEALIKKEYGQKLKPVTIPHHKGRKRMHLELKDTVTKLMTSDFKQTVIDSVSAALGTVYNIATGAPQKSKEEMVEQVVHDQMSNKSGRDSPDNDDLNPKNMESQLNQGNRIDFVLQEAPFESFNEYVFALGSHLCYWQSEDTSLMILKEIYSEMNVFDDQSQSIQSVKPPTNIEYPKPPTAILVPPPTPMGGPMLGPSVPVSVNTNPTPIMMPPPTPIGGSMAGPPVLMVKNNEMKAHTNVTTSNTFSPDNPPSTVSMYAPPEMTSANTSNAAPTMINAMSPPFKVGPPPSKGYPKPSSYPPINSPSNHIGMDPTAPILKTAPIGPPPIGGFIRK